VKILHVVHQFLPEQVGGTELYTHWTTQRLVQRGHQVSVFYRRYAPARGLDTWSDDGVQVWAAWSGEMSPSGRFLATFNAPDIFKAFCQVVNQVGPDIIHIQHLMGLPIAIVNQIEALNIPFIITLHDYWWICANAQLLTNYSRQRCDGPRAYLNCACCALSRAGQPHLWPALPPAVALLGWRNRRLRRVMNLAQTLIAPSDFARTWYQAHGAPTDSLVVIPHGLDAPPESRQNADKERPFRFAMIGGLSWQKGAHVLLEAFQGMQASVELWIGGDETADPAYTARLRGLASPRVSFLGRLTRPAVWQTLAQVDVVIAPSLWYETFSFIISEAFAAGRPVVASRLGPLADRVQHEVNGLLVEPGDPQALRRALLRFLEEPDLLPHLQAGIEPVYTLDDHVARLETVYEAALTGSRVSALAL
jgi:glycosyltransferase involved in cell wall biosynthesis